MPDRVAIVGVGHTQFRATSPGLSYKEIMFEAATKAYADAPKAARKGSILDIQHLRPARTARR